MRVQVSRRLFLLCPGFGLCGTPDTLIGALAKRKDVRNITAVSNNAGSGEYGLGALDLTRIPLFIVN